MEVKLYNTREELLAVHPDACIWEWGPVHKHKDGLYVQVYLGQHEWLAIKVDDPTVRYMDPGWEGTEYGWGYCQAQPGRGWPSEEIDAPEREGKPITCDEVLFSSEKGLRKYLGPEDPLLKTEDENGQE